MEVESWKRIICCLKFTLADCLKCLNITNCYLSEDEVDAIAEGFEESQVKLLALEEPGEI